MLHLVQVHRAAAVIHIGKADIGLLRLLVGVLQRAVRVDDRIGQHGIRCGQLTVNRFQFNGLSRLQQRDFAVCVLNRLLDGCADRQLPLADRAVILDQISAEPLVKLRDQSNRQPVIAGFAHLHIDRRAVIRKVQPHDRFRVALGDHFAGKPAFECNPVLIALDMLDILAKIAEHSFHGVLHARQRVKRCTVKALRALRDGWPRQTGIVIKFEKITLCIIALCYLGDSVDHPTAVRARRGD